MTHDNLSTYEMTSDSTIESQIGQMKKGLGVKTDAELASYLKIDPSTVAAWRRRNKIPDKHLGRFSIRIGEAIAELTGSQSYQKLCEAYKFALIGLAGHNLKERVFVGNEDLTNTWAGFRLSRLYTHVNAILESCPIGDREELRKQYQALRKRLEADDLYEWIETLPE